MTDLHGEIARLKLLLSESNARADRLEKLRVLGVEMRGWQKNYFLTHEHDIKREAIKREKEWDRLADEADPRTGKPVMNFAQGELFPEQEIKRLGGADADIVPRGPQVDRLLAYMKIILAKPAGCRNCMGPDIPASDYRTHEDNSLDVLMWARGYLSSILSCGMANDAEDGARQLVDGLIDIRAF